VCENVHKHSVLFFMMGWVLLSSPSALGVLGPKEFFVEPWWNLHKGRPCSALLNGTPSVEPPPRVTLVWCSQGAFGVFCVRMFVHEHRAVIHLALSCSDHSPVCELSHRIADLIVRLMLQRLRRNLVISFTLKCIILYH
jgi:hypothetical protein